MESEIDIQQVEKRIRGLVKRQMDKSQRENYLNEQVKAIQKEQGEQDENAEMEELEQRIKNAAMPKEALAKVTAQAPMPAIPERLADCTLTKFWKLETLTPL